MTALQRLCSALDLYCPHVTVSIPRQAEVTCKRLEQGIQITLAYNIGVFVVRNFCHDETEERIGELTGILVRLLTSLQEEA